MAYNHHQWIVPVENREVVDDVPDDRNIPQGVLVYFRVRVNPLTRPFMHQERTGSPKELASISGTNCYLRHNLDVLKRALL